MTELKVIQYKTLRTLNYLRVVPKSEQISIGRKTLKRLELTDSMFFLRAFDENKQPYLIIKDQRTDDTQKLGIHKNTGFGYLSNSLWNKELKLTPGGNYELEKVTIKGDVCLKLTEI